jgi:outer membrane lipoprotein-sorting protein
MRFNGKLILASLATVGCLLAQGPPPGGGGPGGRGGPGGGMGGLFEKPVSGAPFSATVTDSRQETLADGNQIQETHAATVYRDSEGRVRVESSNKTPSGETRTMITISDPVAGFLYHLNPADSTAVKQVLPTPHSGSGGPRPSADANAPARVKSDLGASTIAGLAATGSKITTTVPAGAMGNAQALVETREVWTSTALKIPVQVTSTDPRRGTSTMVLSNVSQNAPEATLFQVPSGYTVKDAPAGHGRGGPPPSNE